MLREFFLLASFTVIRGQAPPERCQQYWVKVGCFHDNVVKDRPLPGELVNHRSLVSPNSDGHLLDWREWELSVHALACKCAELTRQAKHKYFGLQFYGECWSGDNAALRYFKDGPSTNCFSAGYNKCNHSNAQECVGGEFTNYVYSVGDDGGFSDWSKWSECSTTCGAGKTWRKRTCTNPPPRYGGKPCFGETKETKTCNIKPCPVHGVWSDWQAWADCSVTCGDGQRKRTRTCTNPAPMHGGKPCEGSAEETGDCNVRPCPIDGKFCPWSLWTFCTVTCGGGKQLRSRTCTEPAPQYGGKPCEGPTVESAACSTQECIIDGGFTNWGAWGACDVTCGNGNMLRSRTCTNPSPQGGGKECVGSYSETKSCTADPCPIDGGLSSWSEWGACSVSCGDGKKTRSRSCTNPVPQFGGKPCAGILAETQDCNLKECPIDGGYTTWTQWGSCSLSCGGGICTRARSCTNPPPQFGGKACEDSAQETKGCQLDPCPIAGGYTTWSNWGACTTTCGPGIQKRNRSCTNPVPMYGGGPCVGPDHDTQDCNNIGCPVDGGYTEWGQWTPTCTVTCGGGYTLRSRTCTNPVPTNGGKPCEGSPDDSKACNVQNCPIDGGFTPWSAWASCSVTCGDGVQKRNRTCSDPIPQFGGKPCDGMEEESQSCNLKICPIDGGLTEWSLWGSCSKTCGTGKHQRTRSCTNPAPQFDGKPCTGLLSDEEDCNKNACPIDGEYGPWSPWAQCNVTCGGGTQIRSRICTAPQFGGKPCEGAASETQACNTNPCPIDGKYENWGPWGTCSQTCGTGSYLRSRVCLTPQHGGKPCDGPSDETATCNTQPCPIDGGYNSWSSWADCSVSCGGGVHKRNRQCTNPAPQFGGKDCSLLGPAEESGACNSHPCPIDGGFTTWNPWGSCSFTCGGGHHSRSRACTNPVPQFGGQPCNGSAFETAICNPDPCPVDGGFGDWSPWSQCNVTCGGGAHYRQRNCTVPQFGGKPCEGPKEQVEVCNSNPCPIDGGYTPFSIWEACSVTCGGGTHMRSRSCTQPPPQFGGKPCEGPANETEICNANACPIDGGLTLWGQWEACDVTCGGGRHIRRRTCTNPEPQFGGKNCSDSTSETGSCNSQPCPIDGGYTNWTPWGTCSVTCGSGGTHSRTRTCTDPVPQHNGKPCSGNDFETESCSRDPCPIDGGFTTWTEWGQCSVSCGGGSHNRTRSCTNPAPQFGGKPCNGSIQESQACNSNPCPIDGGYTPWAAWGQCSASCGGGQYSRSRTCTNPTPQHGGKPCNGSDLETGTCGTQPCPINGGYTPWTPWAQCSVSCGGGSQSRSRSCTQPEPQFNGLPCQGPANETENCNTQPCPIDGKFTTWSSWTTCNATCGGGTHSRSRTCTNPAPQFGGKQCTGSPAESEACNTNPCPIDGGYTSWSQWAQCSVSCGGGVHSRARTCTQPAPQFGGKPCEGPAEESQTCNSNPCPIDGGYSPWGEWAGCSVSCGGGTRNQERTCTNPIPQFGGNQCNGPNNQSEACNPNPCPIDGGFTVWTNWGSCSHPCGGGIQSRSRSCTNPEPQFGGVNCTGNTADIGPCNSQSCPIDGGYSPWSAWGSCSVTCGNGTYTRTRTCTSPTPQFGGKPCDGPSSETGSCNTNKCPIDGAFSEWSSWQTCSLSCGGGSHTRTRSCTNPVPQHGGKTCEGADFETGSCNPQACPIDGVFTEWTGWSICSATCGGGVRSKSRTCTNPAPQFGGKNCTGAADETEACNTQLCAIHGNYTDWSTWSTCSATCGGGYQSRMRTCTNPAPQNGGNPCVGKADDMQPCNIDPCPIDGGLTSWSEWGQCSVSCGGGGKRERTRSCTNPEPQHGGKPCVGELKLEENCGEIPCPIDGNFTTWVEWSPCSVTCGTGVVFRTRNCTNPAPQHGGKDCVGSPYDSKKCVLDICAVVEVDGTDINTCARTLDIGVIMDASSSVGVDNYQKMKNFFIGLTKVTTVSDNGTHFGIMHYSFSAYVDVTFADTQYYDRDVLEEKINKIFYSRGGTETVKALNTAKDKLFCDTCGKRNESAKVLLVMTDGKSTSTVPVVEAAAKQIKDLGVTLISIGIGDTVEMGELIAMANDEGHVFHLDNFNELSQRLQTILDLSCGTFDDPITGKR